MVASRLWTETKNNERPIHSTYHADCDFKKASHLSCRTFWDGPFLLPRGTADGYFLHALPTLSLIKNAAVEPDDCLQRLRAPAPSLFTAWTFAPAACKSITMGRKPAAAARRNGVLPSRSTTSISALRSMSTWAMSHRSVAYLPAASQTYISGV